MIRYDNKIYTLHTIKQFMGVNYSRYKVGLHGTWVIDVTDI